MRPQIRAGRKPGHSISTGPVHDEPRAYRGHARVRPTVSLRACGARPSAGGPSDGEMALRGKPRDNVEVGFLGGTHSVRPQIRAGRKPGHSISTGPVHDEPRAYQSHASVKPMPPFRACGARPSAGGEPRLDGLARQTRR